MDKNQISLGKIYGLRKCATSGGFFVMLALDHRGNLRRSINPTDPESVSYEQMVSFKRRLIAALSSKVSGVLLDPEYGAGQVIASGELSTKAGLLVALEKTGYAGDPHSRESKILPGWSVEKIARLGAAAVKLLVYYHPGAKNASLQEELVKQVGETCQAFDIPFFLEPLSFSLDPKVKKLTSNQKRKVVVETAHRLTPLGVDILKAEFPLDITMEKNEGIWLEACQELTEASAVPWVLLSAGVSYDDFARQTQVACMGGSSGVLAGRAVWKEVSQLRGAAQEGFLQTTAIKRLESLKTIVLTHGQPWTDSLLPPEVDSLEGWYSEY